MLTRAYRPALPGQRQVRHKSQFTPYFYSAIFDFVEIGLHKIICRTRKNMPSAKDLVFIVEFALCSRHISQIENLYKLNSLLFIPP